MKKLVVLAMLLLAGGCGVKPTPVVSAGPAPTLRNLAGDGRGGEVILYFVVNGRTVPVTRPTGRSTGVEPALSLLLAGPSETEAADGYVTMLPHAGGPIALAPGSPTTIRLPFPVGQLNAIAVNQVVCTAFAAMAAVNASVVDNAITLAGPDTRLPAQTCQAF